MRGDREKFRKAFATVILVALVGFLLYALAPFLKAFIGAFIIFYLFNPLHEWFVKRGLHRRVSVGLILVLVLVVVIVPLFFASKLMVQEVASLAVNNETLTYAIQEVNQFMSRFSLSINTASIIDRLPSVSNFVTDFLVNAVGNAVRLVLNLAIFFFALYFLLLDSRDFFKRIKPYIPFSKKHTDEFVEKFKDVSYATIISTGLLAVFQGVLITAGFWFFGLKGAILWGFMTMVVSFLPVVGIPLIYIPAGLIQIIVRQDYFAGIGIIVWGAVASVSESLLRPYMQQRMGKLHPLVTLTGVFFGVPMFGLLGLFIGPLLLSFAVLLIRVYADEYA